jgi:hypothetical protein
MARPETYSDRDVLIGVVVAGVFVFVISGLVGHFGAPSGSRWELTSILGTALGTTLLAGATGFLAYSTGATFARLCGWQTSRRPRSMLRCSQSLSTSSSAPAPSARPTSSPMSQESLMALGSSRMRSSKSAR